MKAPKTSIPHLSTRNLLRCVSLAGVAFATACATHPDDLQTSYVSPDKYASYDCGQISAEKERVDARANELYQTLKGDAEGDVAQTAVGLVLFWPALLFLEGGDGPEATEYTRLKGEKEALEKTEVEKKCYAVTASASADTVADQDPVVEQLEANSLERFNGEWNVASASNCHNYTLTNLRIENGQVRGRATDYHWNTGTVQQDIKGSIGNDGQLNDVVSSKGSNSKSVTGNLEQTKGELSVGQGSCRIEIEKRTG